MMLLFYANKYKICVANFLCPKTKGWPVGALDAGYSKKKREKEAIVCHHNAAVA
jgi:hypothetical protein